MMHQLQVCLTTLTLAAVSLTAAAQSPSIPMQRGISVELPATRNAVAVPDADKEDALVLAVTHDGNMYLGTDRVSPGRLAERIKTTLAGRKNKELYLKADARAPYASVVKVLDTLREAGVEGLTLLTSQREEYVAGSLVSPKGLEISVHSR